MQVRPRMCGNGAIQSKLSSHSSQGAISMQFTNLLVTDQDYICTVDDKFN